MLVVLGGTVETLEDNKQLNWPGRFGPLSGSLFK